MLTTSKYEYYRSLWPLPRFGSRVKAVPADVVRRDFWIDPRSIYCSPTCVAHRGAGRVSCLGQVVHHRTEVKSRLWEFITTQMLGRQIGRQSDTYETRHRPTPPTITSLVSRVAQQHSLASMYIELVSVMNSHRWWEWSEICSTFRIQKAEGGGFCRPEIVFKVSRAVQRPFNAVRTLFFTILKNFRLRGNKLNKQN